MSDLTKEELLEWLRCLYVEGIETIQAEDDVDHEEAHDQLVKIVEGHFKYKYLDNDPECYHVADQGLGEEELLEWFSHTMSINRKTTDIENRRVHAQLQAIIKRHFNPEPFKMLKEMGFKAVEPGYYTVLAHPLVSNI